jgi:hypothetical protein
VNRCYGNYYAPREEFIAELKDEIARLKGEKARPKIKPSRLEPSGKSNSEPEAEKVIKRGKNRVYSQPGSSELYGTTEITQESVD